MNNKHIMKTVYCMALPVLMMILSCDRQGDMANKVAVGDRMFSVFKNRDQGFWMLAIYDAGVWKISPISMPGADIRIAKLAAIGDTPYIVYHDQDGDIIKCAPGIPPVE
jgi:hypothetical protein